MRYLVLAIMLAIAAAPPSSNSRVAHEPNRNLLRDLATTSEPKQLNALTAYQKVPLAFVQNAGYLDPRVRFSAQAGKARFFFTLNEVVFAFSNESAGSVLRLAFSDTNATARLEAGQPTSTKINYLLGNDPTRWRTGLPTYRELVYRDLWPGIDLAFRGEDGKLKYEFHVAPGADPNKIKLRYEGSERLSLSSAGDLLIHTKFGTLTDSPPVSYQDFEGKRVSVSSNYWSKGHDYGITVGTYDPSRLLVIDPSLAYSTFLGGGGGDVGLGIAVDAAGNSYITGETGASNFPTTIGAFDETFNGGTALGRGDVFVTKLNSSGTAVEYSTYLGGSFNDAGTDITVDASGNAYVTGWTDSTNFPVTDGAFDTTDNSGTDAFVTKLNSTGSALVYSTYLGGSLTGVLGGGAGDQGTGIRVDSEGNAYVAGSTDSRDFPTTVGAFDTSYTSGAGSHVFVTKFNAAGSALVYSTYLGGGSGENAEGIALDSTGHVYVTGTTRSASFPTTAGAYDTTPFFGTLELFVTKLNSDGSGLIYSTFLGGDASDQGTGIAIDTAGNAYVTGWGNSTNYPTTAGAFDTTSSTTGGSDAFVSKLNADGSALVYSTYLGGTGAENCWAIAVDSSGNAFVTGNTTSVDFPTTAGSFDPTQNGNSDVFLTKLNLSGSALLYSTFLGGPGSDVGRAITTTSSSSVIVAGQTTSTTFPISSGAFQPTIGGGIGGDGFVLKLSNHAPSAVDDNVLTDEDVDATINLVTNDTDLDGDALIISEVSQGTHGSVSLNSDNTVTYSPEADFNGTDSFTYVAIDTWGDMDTGTVSVTINPVNDAPVATAVSVSTQEDVAVQVNFSAADIDSGGLTFVVVDAPSNGTLGPITNGTVTYTPNSNFNGSDTFTFKANDGALDSNVAGVSIAITAVNDAPDAVDDSVSTNEETAAVILARSNDVDVDNDTLVITSVGPAAHGLATVVDNNISYTPATNFFGADSFSYTVSDGNGGVDTAVVNVTVTNVQDAPAANDDTATVSEDSIGNTINVLANDLDVDGDVLVITAVTQASHGTVVHSGGSVSYTPHADYVGPDSFDYTVADGQGGLDSATVTVSVININDPVIANNDSYQTSANTTLVVSAPGVLGNDTDVDGDALLAELVTNVSNGTLEFGADGSFTYVPDLNFAGTDSFSYRAADGTTNSNVALVQITIVNNLIVFSSTRDGNAEIYAMGIDGAGQTRVTNHPSTDIFPTWSPDKTKIAFISDRDGTFEVFVMNADGSSPMRLTTGVLAEGAADWSADGSKLVFTSRRDGNAEIYVMNADGTGLLRLTKNRATDIKPSWSPDGSMIVFSSDRKRSFEIYVMNADGTDLIQLTKNSFADTDPAWSPDGTKVVFTSDRDGNLEIYSMNSDGTGLTRLTNNAAADDEPMWSSDGLKIVFTSQRDGNTEIYSMNIDGSAQTRLTTNAAIDRSPN